MQKDQAKSTLLQISILPSSVKFFLLISIP